MGPDSAGRALLRVMGWLDHYRRSRIPARQTKTTQERERFSNTACPRLTARTIYRFDQFESWQRLGMITATRRSTLGYVRRTFAADSLDLGLDWLEGSVFVLKFAEVVCIGPVRRVHRLRQ